MRKAIYWLGVAILCALPVVFIVQAFMIQDLPKVEMWKWAVPAVAFLMVYFARDKDDVLQHHVA